MFCPEGYISWGDMREMTSGWSEKIWLAKTLENKGKDPSSAFEDSVNPSLYLFDPAHSGDDRLLAYKENVFICGLLEACIISKVMLQFNTRLCSSEGVLMRATDAILLHEDRLDWCYWSWPLRNTTEFDIFLSSSTKGNSRRRTYLEGFAVSI